MIKHRIELDQLLKWQPEQKVLFASSSKEQKHLYCTLRGSYQVYHKNVLALETMQPFTAVEKYNGL